MSEQTREIAAELDRRHRRRRLAWLCVWAALIAAAAMYVRCGRGWGLGAGGGGLGIGGGTAPRTHAPAPPSPCSIRVTAAGITADGKSVDAPGAVAACTRAHQATVVVTGDAREGTWKAVCDALVAAHVAVMVRGDAQVCPP
jgi:hypothetical protein